GVTHEFNVNWIKGLKTYPLGKHWRDYGAGLARVLYDYFGDGWTDAPLQPWLKSSFETGVSIDYDEPTRQLDRLVGTDAVTGYNWERDVPSNRANFFNLVRHPEPEKFVRTELVETEDRNGEPTRALHMQVTAHDPTLVPGRLNRNEYSIFHPEYNQAYTRYWMKLQDNYLEVAPRDDAKSWRMFFELKEPDSGVERKYAENNRHTGSNNYRISCYIRRKADDGTLYWHIRGEAPQPFRTIDWEIFNDEVPVPVGRWFQVEVFFRH